MIRSRRTRVALLAAGIALSTAACGSDAADTGAASEPAAAPSMSAAPSETTSTSTEPFGAGCAAVPATGAGSFTGMSTAPVATAASNNPALSTLVSAVKQAGLVDTLNGLQAATVFAPSNDAFAKIPAAQLQAVLKDKAMLTKILTYHVVPEKVAPDMLASAPLTTVQKGTVSVTGSGEDFTVNDSAKVVCGNVQTANATVYIIDSVLLPK